MSISKPSVKKQLAFRASYETYNKIMSLCSGDNPAFESVSEYLLTVVNRDLSIRDYISDTHCSYASDEFISLLSSALDNPSIRSKILAITSHS